MGGWLDRFRLLAASGLAGAVVLVDSASRLLSMCADLVLVGALMAVMYLGKKKDKGE